MEKRSELINKVIEISTGVVAADALESLDFDIVDKKYVWVALLLANRKIKEGKIVFDREELEKYKRFHDNLFAEASDIDF